MMEQIKKSKLPISFYVMSGVFVAAAVVIAVGIVMLCFNLTPETKNEVILKTIAICCLCCGGLPFLVSAGYLTAIIMKYFSEKKINGDKK